MARGIRQRVLGWDEALSERIAAQSRIPGVRPAVSLLSHSCNSPLWVLVGLVLYPLQPQLASHILLVIGTAFVITHALKGLVRRPRPSTRRLSIATNKFAFPSGHALRASALASSFYLFWPQWWVLWLLWPLLVGFARVARTAHFFSDVAVGLLLGSLLGPALLLLTLP